VLRDFYDVWPEKFQNKTNGVTPRRFIMRVQPAVLADLLTETLGEGWLKDLYAPARNGTLGRRCRIPGTLARGEAANASRTSPRYVETYHRHRTGPGQPVRRAGQAHPRIQTPASEPAAHHHALSTGCA
jgi:hypothetical protein